MVNKPTLYIVDGSGYIFRAYYAIRHLSNSKGLPTNAVYGFTQMLLKLIKDENPEYLLMVFDSKEPSFRKKEYDLYKANREVPPDDLIPQFDYIKQVVRALNIPTMELPGFEADDIIATVAKQLVPPGQAVVIVTGDKDLMQLVGDQVQLLDEMKDRRIGFEEVKEKFGVRPEQVVDVLALMGDSSDNIPGVPGIGPKTAGQLIQQYGSLDGLYEHLSELKGKKAEDLKKYKDQAYLSKKLATLHEEVPCELGFEDFNRRPHDEERCRLLFAELEFNALLKEFGGGTPKTLSDQAYRLVVNDRDFEAFLARLKKAERFALDTETTSLNTLQARLVGLSFALEPGLAYYLPVGHTTSEEQLNLDRVLSALRPILENPKIFKIGQNCKYDAHILRNHGIELGGIEFDTMLASYLLDPAIRPNLDNLAARFLNHKMTSFSEVAGKKGEFALVPLQDAANYSCEDADVTLQLWEIFRKKLPEQGLEKLFHEVEIPLSGVLLKMERRGIKVDRGFLTELQRDFGERIATQEKKIQELAGEPFNIASPKQLGVILFEKLKLPTVKKTKTGFSTDVDVLTELSRIHALPKEILEYRMLTKLKSTYVDALLGIANPQTDRVHTSFNQTVAETGRLSSSDPNLQNIPIRSEDGAKIRRAFVAPAGYTLMAADYSQIELRVLAHLSGDKVLLQAFSEDQDVHRLTAAGIFSVPEAEVSPAMRSAAKTVNFGVIYGQTPFGLSQQLGVSQVEARQSIDAYFLKYAGVKAYREEVLAEVRKKKEVRTLMGRRRFVPEIDSRNTMARNLAERIAFNTVIQGTAADIIKKAMVELELEMERQGLKSQMLLQVHDELVFEVEASEREKVKSLIREMMEGTVHFRVKLSVDVGEGASWGEAHR